MPKLCLSAKFPHQEIRRNYGIFRSVCYFHFSCRTSDTFSTGINKKFEFALIMTSIVNIIFSSIPQHKYNNNFVFKSVPRIIGPDLGTNQACGFGAMTEGNILGASQKDSYFCIYCPNMLKTYQRKSILFEFLPYTNREELQITAVASLGNVFPLQCLDVTLQQLCSS